MSALTDTFTSLADAIRSRTGLSSTFPPAQMASEINSIEPASIVDFEEYKNSTIATYTGNETHIFDQAFYNCKSLTTVSFPKCVYVGKQAFEQCSSLLSISFPKCTYIVKSAFQSCSTLTAASFPECSDMGNYAFRGCWALSTIYFPKCTNVGGYDFANCSALTIASFPECRTIGDWGFQYCTALTTASFPKCESIGYAAFRYCAALSSLYLLSTSVPTLGSYAFNGTPFATGTGKIYVKSSLVNAFKTASSWSYYSNVIVGM